MIDHYLQIRSHIHTHVKSAKKKYVLREWKYQFHCLYFGKVHDRRKEEEKKMQKKSGRKTQTLAQMLVPW